MRSTCSVDIQVNPFRALRASIKALTPSRHNITKVPNNQRKAKVLGALTPREGRGCDSIVTQKTDGVRWPAVALVDADQLARLHGVNVYVLVLTG